jgi:hypothetical protein
MQRIFGRVMRRLLGKALVAPPELTVGDQGARTCAFFCVWGS